MFWGCFSLGGTGQLIAIRGIMKSEDWIKILEKIYNYQHNISI